MSRTLGGRTILITGGSGAVGLEAARAVHALGADVIIGSRDRARYETVANELGHRGVHPFIADLVDSRQTESQVELLYRRGLRPTDVIHCAAGGMESVLRDLVRLMIGLRKLHGEELDRAHAAAREELTPLVEATRADAMAVNCTAPSRLLEVLTPEIPSGGTVIFYSTFWATLYPHPQVPVYYDAVAQAKRAFEMWLEEQSGGWAAQGITTAIVSTSLIADTRMGYLLNRFCAEAMPAPDRERWRSTFVSCSELVEATLDLLSGEGIGGPAGLRWIFIPAPGTIVDHVGSDHPSVSFPLALAPNAPVWARETLVS